MITRTVEELYDVVSTRGGLTRAVECERMVSYMRFTAGIAAQPVAGDEGAVSGFAPTVPERREAPRSGSPLLAATGDSNTVKGSTWRSP